MSVFAGDRSRGDHWPQCGRAVSHDVSVSVPQSQTEARSSSQTQTQPEEGARVRPRWAGLVTVQTCTSVVVYIETPRPVWAATHIQIAIRPEFQDIVFSRTLSDFQRSSQTFSDTWRVTESLMRRDGIVKITGFLWCLVLSFELEFGRVHNRSRVWNNY